MKHVTKRKASNLEVLEELKKLNATMSSLVNIIVEDDEPTKSDPEEEDMFAALDACTLPNSTRDFIDSLQEGFSTYGFLTDKQYECLHRNYMRFVHGKRFSV